MVPPKFQIMLYDVKGDSNTPMSVGVSSLKQIIKLRDKLEETVVKGYPRIFVQGKFSYKSLEDQGEAIKKLQQEFHVAKQKCSEFIRELSEYFREINRCDSHYEEDKEQKAFSKTIHQQNCLYIGEKLRADLTAHMKDDKKYGSMCRDEFT
mmetsp:Transcript_27758/g.26816  ORF Transcript_27758/g.26816 Transcript_27758/m.26816 type:complete len:151 (+) Transcript_27758:399-851(+)